MYPSTKFEIVDQSLITDIPQVEPVVKPMFMAAFTSDKGSEDYGVYEGDDFFKQFGTDIKFAKHGQPLLQAAMQAKAGARLYCKRIVADDATLGNLILAATVTKTTQTKMNGDKPVYDYGDGETTEVKGEDADQHLVTIPAVEISYSLESATSGTAIKSVAGVEAIAAAMYDTSTEGTWVYPLAVFADNGRGISKKRVRIEADYASSKSVNYCRYSLYVMEGNSTLEALGFTFNPDITYDGASTSLDSVVNKRSKQIKAGLFENYVLEMYQKVAETIEMDVEELLLQDILFGKTKAGAAINTITISDDKPLDSEYGYVLAGGSNGSFADAPVKAEGYAAAMVHAFDGTLSTDIYDLNNLKMYAIVDANYPKEVKSEIEKLVNFRQDTVFIRDIGTGVKTLSDILAEASFADKSMFTAVYHNSYDIVDPFTKKQITVTATYDIAQLLVKHINNGVSRALAGISNGFTFDNAIEGTINFIPTVTPGGNQKEKLDDARINYIGYYDGVPVMETTYTNYQNYSSLSYVQNVMAIQELIRAIRSKCPKIRYNTAEATDLQAYQAEVQLVIDKFAINFADITLEYYADDRYEANMIYYAGLNVKCKKFIQAEFFKVIVL